MTIRPEDATAVPAAAMAAVATIRNVITGTINVTEIHHTDAPAAVGLTMSTAQMAAAIRQENATAVLAVVATIRNVITETINVTEIHHTDAPAAAGLTMSTAQMAAAIRQENATAVLAVEVLAVNILHVHQS